jgi:radical SAM-linked protein
MNDNTPVKQRLYITFGKFDALIYTSNLDVAKMWERVLRRANLPLLYTEGFNPRPRIALASALPLGISSECEILDVSLKEILRLEGLAERIAATSPTGLKILDVQEVPVRSPALQMRVRSAEYRIHFETSVDQNVLQEKVSAILAAEQVEIERERKEKVVKVNLRPLIYDLGIDEQGNLIAHVMVGERGNVRPDEILTAMELAEYPVSVHRFHLHLETNRE